MNSDSWKSAVPEDDWRLYEEAGFGRSSEFGRSPALLIIDVQYRTVGDEPLPVRDSMRRYGPTSCGEPGWRAIGELTELLSAARTAGIPVVYPFVAPKSKIDAGRSGEKIPSLMTVDEHGYEFVSELAPRDRDLLLPKRHPSAFFGTPLASYLIDMRVDTLLLTGCTTSGCVRATAVDAYAYNFHVGVIEDCVFDRSETSHNVNLFDIQSKYGEVIGLKRALAYLVSVRTERSGAL